MDQARTRAVGRRDRWVTRQSWSGAGHSGSGPGAHVRGCRAVGRDVGLALWFEQTLLCSMAPL